MKTVSVARERKFVSQRAAVEASPVRSRSYYRPDLPKEQAVYGYGSGSIYFITARDVATSGKERVRLPCAHPNSDFELRAKFLRLARKWRVETMLSSSLRDKFEHPAYKQIIAMGEPALPLIFKELERRPAYWFWAIDAIVGHGILPEGFQGNFDRTLALYKEWGNTFLQNR
jgi:hypothetical protein